MTDMRDDMQAAQQRNEEDQALAELQALMAAESEPDPSAAPAAGEPAPAPVNAPGAAGVFQQLGDPAQRGSMGEAARDLAVGGVRTAREAPGAVWHGFADAVNETVDLAYTVGESVGSFLEDNAGPLGQLDPRITWRNPETGDFELGATLTREQVRDFMQRAGVQEEEDLAPQLPTGPDQRSAGGQFVESMAQFLTGFLGAGRVRSAAGVATNAPRLVRSAVDSALASFTVFDGHEARLADVIEMSPTLSNPVTEFLASDEDDPELVGRMKNALEDIGLGAVADTFVAGVRAIKGSRRARNRAQRVLEAEAELDQQAQADFRDIMKISGDPNAAPIQVVSEPSRLTMDMLERSRRDLEDGIEIGQTEARALVETAERWAAEVKRLQPERAQTIEDLAAQWRERGDPDAYRALLDAMDEARQPVQRPPSLIDFLRDTGGLVDEGAELSARDLAGQTDAINRFTSGKTRQQLDDAARAAWEAGYFPDMEVRPTINQFLDALDRDARAAAAQNDSARVFSQQDDAMVQALQSRQQAADFLEEWEVNYTDRSRRAREASAADATAERAVQEGATATLDDLISVSEAMDAAGARYGVSFPDAAALGAQDVRINFNALNTSDDIRSVIGQLADSYADDIATARGDVRGNATLFDEQSELGSAWSILEQRRRGEPLTDSQVIAAQRLYIASAENVRRAARMVADRSNVPPSAAALSDEMLQFNLNRAISVHRAIQAEIAGAKADAGRALRAWQVVTGTTRQARDQLMAVVDQYGGRIDAKGAARLAAMGAEELDRAAQYGSVREAMSAVGADFLRLMFLSGPKTHLMNMAGNSLTTVFDTLPRLGAGLKGRLLGDPELEAQLGVAVAQWVGLRAGLAAQFRAFARSADYGRMNRMLGETVQDMTSGRVGLRQGLQRSASTLVRENPITATWRGRFDDMGVSGRKLDDGAGAGGPAVSAERFGVSGDTAYGQFLNGVGRVLSAPTDFLGWQDDFFKGVSEVSERHAMAYERAARELGEQAITRDEFAERYAFYVNNPTPDMTAGARTAAQRRTFTEPVGRATRNIMGIRRAMNSVFGLPIGHLLLPFVVTPSNILKFAFQSSPFGLLFREIQDDLAAGGARRAMAQSRMAAGTGLLMYGMDLASKGYVTGSAPSEPGARELWERMGVQEYSIRVGDKWVSYRRLEPVSTMLAIGADLSQISHNIEQSDDPLLDAGELIGPAVGAAISVVTSKTYLTGLAELVQFVEDPERYGTSYIERTLSSVTVPTLVSEVERAIDPEVRAAHNAITEFLARMPGFSGDLPLEYDLWGRPRSWQSGVGTAYDVLSPFVIRKQDPEPVDEELYRIGHFPRRPASRISVPYNGQTVEVSLNNSPHIYQRYVQLAGNGAAIERGMGARDLLNAIVSGEHRLSRQYQALPDAMGMRGSKREMIDRIIAQGREIARAQIHQEFRAELGELARRHLAAQERAFERREEGDPLLTEG